MVSIAELWSPILQLDRERREPGRSTFSTEFNMDCGSGKPISNQDNNGLHLTVADASANVSEC